MKQGELDVTPGTSLDWLPNLLELDLNEYCIVAAQIFPIKHKYSKVLEFASISCHDALLADQEAFKHQVCFWVVCITDYFSPPLSLPYLFFKKCVALSTTSSYTAVGGREGHFLKNRSGGRNGRLK